MKKRDYFEEFSFIPNKPTVDVTIILNIWKREHLIEQLFCILSQTVVPREIWIIHYEDHVAINDIVEKYKLHFQDILTIKSDKNLKYFGRFSIAINVATKFTWIVDDDVMPGNEWLENCVNKCDVLNSIVTCSGRIIPQNNFEPERPQTIDRDRYFVGDILYLFRNYCASDTKVDYACNSYFFKTEWLSTYWKTWPATFLTGEDIHLSATCKTLSGIDTYVIEQKTKDDSGNNKKIYGNDDNATWRTSNFLSLRKQVLEYHIYKMGWKPLEWI